MKKLFKIKIVKHKLKLELKTQNKIRKNFNYNLIKSHLNIIKNYNSI